MARLTPIHTALGLTMSIVSFISPVFSQQPQPTTPSPTPTAPGNAPGGGNNNPGRNPFPGNNPTQQNPNDQMNHFPEQQRPIFLSGKVMLDDGTPPPDSVVIERVCNGNPRAEAYTDSKGRFSFQLGQNHGMMQDASMSSSRDDFGG